MRRFFARQARTVAARLTGPKARRGTRHWEGVVGPAKALDVTSVFQRQRWDDDLRSEIEGVLTALYKEQGDAMFHVFNPDGAFNVTDPGVRQALSARVTKVVGVNQTTEDAIRTVLQNGEDAGDTIVKIAKGVSDVFDQASGYRAETIARTEGLGAINESAHLAAEQSGVVATKQWLAVGDDRTRASHEDADGQEVGLDESFDVGGSQLMFPGDPDGDPEETINCRCTALFIPADGAAPVEFTDAED